MLNEIERLLFLILQDYSAIPSRSQPFLQKFLVSLVQGNIVETG